MKPDTDQPPMSKSVVKRLQAQGAEPVATKPVQTCADCRHELWLNLENRCKHLIPVEIDEMYHETRCGHKCEIPAEGGGEVELPCPPHSPSGKLWHEWFDRCGEHATLDVVNATATLVIEEKKLMGDTRTSQPAGEASDVGCTCNHICPPRHEREIDDEVVCVHAGYCPLSDNFASQPLPTTEPRHAFERYKKTDYCGASLARHARCGRREHDPIHLSDDIVDDRRVPFSLPTTEARERAREIVRAWVLTSNPHHLIEYKDKLINRIAAALSSTPSERWVKLLANGIREALPLESNYIVPIDAFKLIVQVHREMAQMLWGSNASTPTNEVNKRARAAAEEIATYVNNELHIAFGAPSQTSRVARIITKHFTTDVEGRESEFSSMKTNPLNTNGLDLDKTSS